MTRYVALLRGINVGGRNRIAMADLRAMLESAGYRSVSTYIQSGNVLFTADEPPRGSPEPLEADIERVLAEAVDSTIVVVVRTHEELRRVVEDAPEGFGGAPDTHHNDVVFLKPPLTADQAMSVVRLRDGVDAAWPGEGVLYFQRLSAQRSRSRMSAIVGTPEYQRMTIRNWATTTKLLRLLDHPEGS